MSSFLTRLAGNAGAVDEHIDRTITDLCCCPINARCVCDIHGENVDFIFFFLRQPLELFGRLRLAASRIDVPAVGEILRSEFQTEASICAGNQDGWHWLFIPCVCSIRSPTPWIPERKAKLNVPVERDDRRFITFLSFDQPHCHWAGFHPLR